MPDTFRKKLTDFIEVKIKDSGKSIPQDLNRSTPLISSGLLESLHLLELALLVEEEAGSALDLTKLDFANEWNTIEGILNFVQSYKR